MHHCAWNWNLDVSFKLLHARTPASRACGELLMSARMQTTTMSFLRMEAPLQSGLLLPWAASGTRL